VLGVIQTIVANDLRLRLGTVLSRPASYDQSIIQISDRNEWQSVLLDYPNADQNTREKIHGERMAQREAGWADMEIPSEVLSNLLDFFADRLKVQQREAGVRHDLIDAVFALGGEDDLVRLLARVRALQAFVETPEGADLLAGYKRAANILKKEGWASPVIPAEAGISFTSAGGDPGSEIPASAGMTGEGDGQNPIPLSYTPEPEENALISALDSAEPLALDAIGREDFEGAMAALATLRAPVDAFFEKVTVNDPDPARREARLNLLARMRAAVHRVADFSRIEG